MKWLALLILAGMASIPLAAPALTVRAKSDLRLWETVTDRASPLSWTWEDEADSAVLTFSNRLTRGVSTTHMARTAGALRGTCGHPVATEDEESLVAVTLVQQAGGVEIARDVAELAYVPGVCCVRTKADRDWWRVRRPRLSAFDAHWWEVDGPSGYEVMWATPAGPHRVVREFEGAGVVDETVLKFGTPGFLMMLR